jgi:hypothetical protein
MADVQRVRRGAWPMQVRYEAASLGQLQTHCGRPLPVTTVAARDLKEDAQMRRVSPFRHDAVRDTMWVGKDVPWLVIAGLVALAALAAWLPA